MASTNKTGNYDLNQWARTDGVCMDDFNSDNSKIDAALQTKAKIQTGSYTGADTYGKTNANSITFDFTPKIVFVMAGGSNTSCGFFVWNSGGKSWGVYNNSFEMDFFTNTNTNASTNSVTYSGSTMTWWYASYSSAFGPALRQLNTSDTTYTWVAIG